MTGDMVTLDDADFSNAVKHLVGSASADDSPSSIKALVRRGLLALGTIDFVDSTDYFNHSFAPDFVLGWRDRDGSARERFLYLRVDEQPLYIAQDVERLASRQAIFLSLTGLHGVGDAVGRQPLESDTLVVDAAGLGTFKADQEPGLSTGDIAARSFVRGGRGVVDVALGERIRDDIETGIGAAETLGVSSVKRGVQAADAYFSQNESHQIIELIFAVWIASGGAPSEFPWRRDVTNDGIGDEVLEFLLRADGVRDAAVLEVNSKAYFD